MDEYINRTKLIADIKSRFCDGCDPRSGNMLCRRCEVSYAIGELKGAPTARVKETKHGEWENVIVFNDNCFATCSNCKRVTEEKDCNATAFKIENKFCRNCGTIMGGVSCGIY